MVNIIVEAANNGIIKKIIDDNHGGTNKQWSSLDVYEESDDKLDHLKRFFFDLCDDLGVSTGNKFDREVLHVKKEWGSHYKPTDTDIEIKIKELECELSRLRLLKK